jgi:hypothetical protein
MKSVRIARTAVAVLYLGTIAAAQQDGDKDREKQGKADKARGKQEKGAPSQDQGQKARPQGKQPEHAQQPAPLPQPVRGSQQAQRPDQPRVTPPQRVPPQQAVQSPERPEGQARAWQQQRGWLKQGGGWKGHDTLQQSRAQLWSSDHRTWVQRGGYGGSYIPQDRFRVSFGSQHLFRLGARPVMYQGYPRFEYSGFSFLLLDPWPEYWSDNWYDYDDLYIDYDDGYYLHSRNYSQVRLAITVVL